MKADQDLGRLIELLASAEGFVALVLVSLLVIYTLVSTNGRWFALAIFFYAATLGTFTYFQWYTSVMAPPLQQIRSHGRTIVLGLLVVLLLPAFDAQKPGLVRKPTTMAVAFLVFQLLYALRLITSDAPVKGFLAVVADLLVFAVLGIGLSRWLRSITDVHRLLRAIAAAGVLLCLATAYQAMHDLSALYWNQRYFGTTGNAQHAAVMIALILPVALYLITSPSEPMVLRRLWALTAGMLVLLLLWTGSRTGVGMAVIGISIFGRSQLMRMLPAIVLIGLGALVVLQLLLPESLMTINRYTDTTNTRASPFAQMTNEFLSSPLIGVGGEETRESSYLAVAAKMGLAGLTLMAVVHVLVALEMLKLARLRSYLGEYETLFDLFLAGFAMLAAGGLLEGYMLGVLGLPVLITYCYFALLGFALQAAQSRREALHMSAESIDTADDSRFRGGSVSLS